MVFFLPVSPYFPLQEETYPGGASLEYDCQSRSQGKESTCPQGRNTEGAGGPKSRAIAGDACNAIAKAATANPK